MVIEYKTRTQLVVEIVREKILSGEIVAGTSITSSRISK